jgi:hypothetical protein
MKTDRESASYPGVEKWMKKHFRCFKAATNVGLRYSRIDVLGVKDVGGDLSGEIEIIGIEVKRGTEPFATASGQALGYHVYAHRVYLADRRDTAFTPSELEIASHLGIGLVQIIGATCREILSSPFHRPISRMSLAVVEKLALGHCRMCGTFFEIGTARKKQFSKVTRENFGRAIDQEKGLIFWNRELADRKNKLKMRATKDGTTYERRFICPDCIQYVFAKIASKSLG